MNAPIKPSIKAPTTLPLTPAQRAARKAEVLDVIQRQRARWIARRAEKLALQRLEEEGGVAEDGSAVGGDGFPRSQVMRALTRHPLAIAGGLGVFLFLGPRRVLRIASWLLPFVVRRF